MKNSLMGKCIAEFIGTFLLILFGVGCVATVVLNQSYTSLWEISMVWGLGVTLSIYVTASVSGAHLNPAVTLALSFYRGFPKAHILPFVVAQVAGAFSAAAVTYFMFRPAFLRFDEVNSIVRDAASGMKTAGIFSTYPQAYLSKWEAFAVEAMITAVLVAVIFALTDERNAGAPLGNLAPLIIGLLIAVIGGSFGSLTGFAMNPARDFGPKLFAYFAGWGANALPGPNLYFWVPIAAPIFGALVGGGLYDLLIRPFLPNTHEQHTQDSRKTA